MFYYFLVFISVLLFGGDFFVRGRYTQRTGASLLSSMVFAFGSGLAGCVCLFIANGCKAQWTTFTGVIGILMAINSVLMAICTIYSLDKASLSLFSVLAQMGGMIVPSIVGIIFYDESVTWYKIVCYVLTSIGLAVTIKKEKESKAFFSYVGVFLFNGISAALSTIFSKADFEKGTSADYSIWSTLFKALVALVFIPLAVSVYKKSRLKQDETSTPVSVIKAWFAPLVLILLALSGILNTIGNYLLPVAMMDGGLDGSVVFPLITGGIMIVSTLLGYLNKRKPTKREILAVIICCFGIFFLMWPTIFTA